MIKLIISLLSQFLPPKFVYVRVGPNSFEIKLLGVQNTIQVKPDHEFSNSRLLIANFTIASDCLKSSIEKLFAKEIIPHPKKVIIQQTKILEGGLTEAEKRELFDLAGYIGASYAVVEESTRRLNETEIKRAFDK